MTTLAMHMATKASRSEAPRGKVTIFQPVRMTPIAPAGMPIKIVKGVKGPIMMNPRRFMNVITRPILMVIMLGLNLTVIRDRSQ